MTFIEVDKLLQKDGWQLKKVRGSHYMYENPNKPKCGKLQFLIMVRTRS